MNILCFSFKVWEWLFKSCEVNGRILLRDGLIDVKDVEECLVKGNCKKLYIKLPAWTVLQCLLASAKSNSSGLVISTYTQYLYTNLVKTFFPSTRIYDFLVNVWQLMAWSLQN